MHWGVFDPRGTQACEVDVCYIDARVFGQDGQVTGVGPVLKHLEVRGGLACRGGTAYDVGVE